MRVSDAFLALAVRSMRTASLSSSPPILLARARRDGGGSTAPRSDFRPVLLALLNRFKIWLSLPASRAVTSPLTRSPEDARGRRPDRSHLRDVGHRLPIVRRSDRPG
jgi:hypothetical protein